MSLSSPSSLSSLAEDHLDATCFTKKNLVELREALALGDAETEVAKIDTLLRNKMPLFVSAVRANKRLKPNQRVSVADCVAIAEELDFSEPLPELVPVRPHPKKSGGYRMIHDHGLIHRTAQDAINRVLGEYLKPRSFQFTRKGTHAAIHRARALIEDGYEYLARLDIKDFYSNFNADALIEGLPIPKDVAEHAVVGRHMKVCIDKRAKTGVSLIGQDASPAQSLLPLARQGIPMGSSTSSIVSMMTISRLAWSPTDAVAVINYADDFLVLARQPSKLAVGVETLIEAVAKLSDGHFTLILKEKSSAKKGQHFLGHRFYVNGNKLRVAPSEASMEKMLYKLNQIEMQIQPFLGKPWKKNHDHAIRLAATYYAHMKAYRAAFSACTDLDTRWFAVLNHNLNDALHALGVDPKNANDAIEPWMISKTYAYMFKD